MNKRIIGLDLIRTIAIFFVICVHFYLNSGFYNIQLDGWKLCIAVVFRWLFFICVPLFLILTGYLKSNKEINKNHYKSIVTILTSYAFIAIITCIFRKIYMNHNLSITNCIISILNFGSVGYGWYLEMYLGLFLIIPFLNILWKNLNFKTKNILIFSLLFITSLPSLTNQFFVNEVRLNLFPDWWINIYPLVYYFIGAYLKDITTNDKLKKKIPNKKILFIIFVIVLLIQGILSFWFATITTGKFNKYFLGGYYSIFTVILSTLFFLLLYDIDIKNTVINKVISLISSISFDIYLFSYISDLFIYSYFKEYVGFGRQLIYYAPVCVFMSFGIAFILAVLKKYCFKLINYITKKLLEIKINYF